jgi:copper oxidase (laccase) domain-containing protein
VRALWTGRRHGDARLVGTGPAPRPVPSDLTVRGARQVHGARLVTVGERRDRPVPPEGAPEPEGDALVARRPGWALTVRTADCGALALGSPEGAYAAVHVGWRGLVAGVVVAAAARLRSLGASEVVAGLGPTIGPCCYAFSPGDLDRVEEALGQRVGAHTSQGHVSLDLPGAIGAQLTAAGAVLSAVMGECTVCAPGYFSHRARHDSARQALYVWLER